MLKNYFLVALRNLKRYKLHTAINIAGLAIGISACLLIYQYWHFETSYDNFHPDSDRIYRVYTQYGESSDDLYSGISIALMKQIESSITGIELTAPVHTLNEKNISIPRTKGEPVDFDKQNTLIVTSSNYFELFSAYKWLVGDPQSSLSQPFQVVLTESRAKQYFQTEQVQQLVGREILLEDTIALTISGIVADLPGRTDFYFSDFISYPTIKASDLAKDIDLTQRYNTSSSNQLFVKLMKRTDRERLQKQLKMIAEENQFDSTIAEEDQRSFALQSLSDLHFNEDLGIFDNSGVAANRSVLWAILMIALILLALASINFVNLATAQALQRGKEIGVRKVLGGSKKTIRGQFLAETLLITISATGLAITLADAGMHYFKEFLPDELIFQILRWDNLVLIFALPLILGLLAGFYPAFILSSFAPGAALKRQVNVFGNYLGNNLIRKGLITIQFTVSLVLVILSLVISLQIKYMMDKELGVDTEAIVYFYTPLRQPESKLEVLKNELGQFSEISQLSLHEHPPISVRNNRNLYTVEKDGESIEEFVYVRRVDENYLSMYDLKLADGREFRDDESLKEMVVNETFVKRMGYESTADILGNYAMQGDEKYVVVGVMKDFHHLPLSQSIEPMAIYKGSRIRCVGMKINTSGLDEQLLSNIKNVYQEIYPESPFEYQFLDESIARYYEEERKVSKLVRTASLITIFISCMGLFGLISFSVVRRMREIGIRKVLGASIHGIVQLLSLDFLKLVVLSFIFAMPLALYFAQDWLQNYAYRIENIWWIFVLAGLGMILIALFTIGSQSFKAALANPIDSLRDE